MRGLGTDIIEIERVREAIERYQSHFLNRLYTLNEQNYCLKHNNPYPHFAGRLVAKEALSKALGTGIGKEVGWLDLEILNDSSGKPYVVITPKLEVLFKKPNFLVSISHSKQYALATIILI